METNSLIILHLESHALVSLCIDGKTVLITRGDTPDGIELARELSHRGGRIILGCENINRGYDIAIDIRGETNGEVIVEHVNAQSMKSIRDFCTKILETESKIHVLINNNVIQWASKRTTEDGFELHWGINHMSNFVMTQLLLPLLHRAAPDARIINMTSSWYSRSKGINWNDPNFRNESYSACEAFNQSKLANILFTRELSKRLEGTGVNVDILISGLSSIGTFAPISSQGWQYCKCITSPSQTEAKAALDQVGQCQNVPNYLVLVQSGPFKTGNSFTFPNYDGQTCQHAYFNRLLANGEKVRRSWLLYSKKEDSLNYICYKLFFEKKVHDDRARSIILTWKNLEARLAEGLTIDQHDMELAEAEKRRLHDVSGRLDCTPDLSHKEQLSGIVPVVSQEDIPHVKELFLGFIVVQSRQENIVFSNPEKAYTSLTSHLRITEDSLMTMGEHEGQEKRCSALAEELGSYHFCICTTVWDDVLSKIQYVRKLMQSPSMLLSVAVDLLNKTKHFLISYRKAGYAAAQSSAKQMCEEMNVEAELKQKCLRTPKGTLAMSLQMSLDQMHFENWKPHFLIWRRYCNLVT
ncbi:Retinol dehydrogenase 14,Retinol dehydrogenase 13,Retinol dehydrogenase 11,Retinol dehydrogenase 12 [Lepeophtheirus salmonis]|uniref:Retinol dehydrogenase 14,Retinol dehydrogenase 13,Retinol dehydrogenase 11,Retinol dehydrogenase 12 n=1 Tax=Lepeophtheirus salmonis TaxID=72036 RepID=A0A7R8CKI0_LEPSM|nr:Retinol dehydrogenase 14,Retinol dehydrogenase 13,Retinol dehydrogenase 11,Retinol dehydrogenase 12 [Lepeophtheirus salmonis]CAF2820336.1 Retinol dehydrogenase 14,Retinol dehydrogenase 13,Retinol dehydrogenase 11,Retinol dehydrogenase 12 [Lepeophtheirus salmonis]